MKTFTDTLEQLKAAGSPLEESNEVIMFLYSVDSSPFRPKIMELLGRTPLPDMDTCIHELDDKRLLREEMKANNALVRGSRDQSLEVRKSHHDTIVNHVEAKASITKSSIQRRPRKIFLKLRIIRTSYCYNHDRPGHRALDCPMARVISPCWRSGHMEKHHDTVAKLKAKSSVKRLSEGTKVNKADVEEFSEDSYTLTCSIFLAMMTRLTFPSLLTLIVRVLISDRAVTAIVDSG